MAIKVCLINVLIDAGQVALEDREETFDGIGVNVTGAQGLEVGAPGFAGNLLHREEHAMKRFKLRFPRTLRYASAMRHAEEGRS